MYQETKNKYDKVFDVYRREQEKKNLENDDNDDDVEPDPDQPTWEV